MTPVTSTATRFCAVCRGIIQPGEKHRHDNATQTRMHLRCVPDEEKIGGNSLIKKTKHAK